MQWNGSDTPETFKMTGIVPGNYNLKIYAWDPQYNDKNTSFDIDGNNDGTYDVTMQISNPGGEHDKTCQVTVSAAQSPFHQGQQDRFGQRGDLRPGPDVGDA